MSVHYTRRSAMSRAYCSAIREVFKENPKLIAGLALWLLGYSRLDVYTLLNVDLSETMKYGIIVDEFRDSVKIRGFEFKRFSKESIEKLIGECLTVNDIVSLVDKFGTDEDRKTLAYVSDYVKRMGSFSIYGVSDYIRCSELLRNVNVEFKVLITVLKFLLYACDRTYSCSEYVWTRELIEILHGKLASAAQLPSDIEIENGILSLIREREDGVNIIAAMYSMSTGSIDQFHSFHKRSIQDYLRTVSSIRYVFHDGFLNGLALPAIERVVLRHIVEPLVTKVSSLLKGRLTGMVEESRVRYMFEVKLDSGKVVHIVVPKMYYYSPIFWAMPKAVNIVYEIPHSVQAYVSLYRPYFENGVLVISRGSEIVRVVCFCRDTLCESFTSLGEVMLI